MPPAEVAAAPSPAALFDAINGFQRTAAIKTAIELDVFSHIAAGADTPAALAGACHASARGLRILVDSLAVLGLLHKDGAQYRLTPDSAVFLDRRSPAYLGSIAEFLTSTVNLDAFAKLTAAVRQGGTALAGEPAMQPDSPVWTNFARSMAALQRPAAHALAELLLPKPGGRCKVLDIAAGHGLFGIAMAQRNPEAEVYALDWPQVLSVARENAAAAGVTDRMHWIPGSAFEADLGADYDWVLLPNFLHHFDAATCEGLLRRVRAALAPEGETAVLEFVVEDNRLQPPQSALFSLIMLATTPAGDAYTYAELDAMLRAAGFSETELHPLPPGFQRVVIATP
ncbi:MAG TPA: class I SAM-dependent methyltransferase [Terriglobales bacterium]|jgi:cyclopropane fatty-acyl-phospholipid synthase-like methyltransferase